MLRLDVRERAAARHVPAFVVDAALRLHAPDGRSYAQRLQAMLTERELSELYEDMVARLPLGSGKLLAGFTRLGLGLRELGIFLPGREHGNRLTAADIAAVVEIEPH